MSGLLWIINIKLVRNWTSLFNYSIRFNELRVLNIYLDLKGLPVSSSSFLFLQFYHLTFYIINDWAMIFFFLVSSLFVFYMIFLTMYLWCFSFFFFGFVHVLIFFSVMSMSRVTLKKNLKHVCIIKLQNILQFHHLLFCFLLNSVLFLFYFYLFWLWSLFRIFFI